MGDRACVVLGRGAVVPVGLALAPWGLLPLHPFSAHLPTLGASCLGALDPGSAPGTVFPLMPLLQNCRS